MPAFGAVFVLSGLRTGNGAAVEHIFSRLHVALAVEIRGFVIPEINLTEVAENDGLAENLNFVIGVQCRGLNAQVRLESSRSRSRGRHRALPGARKSRWGNSIEPFFG